MNRWFVIMFIVVTTVLFVFGGVFSIITGLLPEDQKQGILPLTIGFAVTYGLLTIVITLMQWFGISPIDFLPEKTLKQQDRGRYRLSQTKNAKILEDETKRAMTNKEYEWAVLFAEVWVTISPGNERAYHNLSEALLKLGRIDASIKVGENLVKIKKANYIGYRILGESYKQLANWKEAEKWFELALNYAPSDFSPFIHHELADIYESQGEIGKAINSLSVYEKSIDDRQAKIYYQDKIKELKQMQTRLQNIDN